MASPTRLLIADDEVNVAITLQAVLEQDGYEVAVASNGDDARALLKKQDFEVALIDLRLGDEDGIDLLQFIRETSPECVCIILTGYASLDTAIAAVRKGAYDYLVKPCNIDELKVTVARAAERQAIGRSLRERLVELEEANVRIESFSRELVVRIDEATADLSQKVQELSEAKEGVEEAQRAQAEFISMMAHELGQPVTTLMGFAQLLARPNPSPETIEDARSTFLAETERLRRLVRDLADVSMVMGGHFAVNITACRIADIVQEQVKAIQATTGTHTLHLDIQTDPSLMIPCDADRIAQILSNLINNAIKYTESGEITVGVRAQDTHLVITIRDQGPGIPQDFAENIFEPYFRVTHGDKKKTQGMGLGLYITKAIVEVHGGRIELKSSEKPGTTFEIALPLGVPLEKELPSGAH